MDDRDKGFTEYFASRGSAFLGTAYLLCGNWHRAEDLVQTTFLKLYRTWHRIGGREVLDAYTRQILVRTFLHETRGGFFRREQVTDEQADRVAPAAGSPEDRMVLLHALARVPPRQRAARTSPAWARGPTSRCMATRPRGLTTTRGTTTPRFRWSRRVSMVFWALPCTSVRTSPAWTRRRVRSRSRCWIPMYPRSTTNPNTGESCTEVTVAGKQIGVAVKPGKVLVTYLHSDGTLVILSQETLPVIAGYPGLTELPFTGSQLAELAAAPRFHLG